MSLSLINATSNPSRIELDRDGQVSSASEAKESLNDDFDEFMLLLTTQLKNQDPTEPLDTNEFTAQLVQFATVEQAIATNTNLEKLVGLSANSQLNDLVSFVGNTVEVEGTQGFLIDGQAEFAYDVPPGVEKVVLAVLDNQGEVIYSTEGPAFAGRQIFAWDGTNSFTGENMPDGVYGFGVAARDADGEIVDVQTYTTGRVTGVSRSGEEMTMTIGGIFDVTLDQIVSVREPVENPNQATNTAANNNDQQDEG